MGGYRPRPRPDPDRREAHTCNTPMCPCRGETYDYCVGCRRTPNRRLMAWTAEGRYLCRMCRTADGTPEAPAPGLAELLDAVAAEDAAALVPIIVTAPGSAFTADGRMVDEPRCDGRRGNHGDPEIVCAMCADTPLDWGSSRRVSG